MEDWSASARRVVAVVCAVSAWSAGLLACGPPDGPAGSDRDAADASVADATEAGADSGPGVPETGGGDAPAEARVRGDAWGVGCAPSCLSRAISDCAPVGTCVRQADPELPGVTWQCYPNGLRVRIEVDFLTRAASLRVDLDGEACFGVDTGPGQPQTVRDAMGRPVASLRNVPSGRDAGGRLLEVTCEGATTVVDFDTPACAGVAFSLSSDGCEPGPCGPSSR